MQNPIAKIKKTIHDHRDEIIVTSTFTAFGILGAAVACLTIKHELRDAIIVPAKLVSHLKNSSNGIVGLDVIDGFDVYVKLIPVQKL